VQTTPLAGASVCLLDRPSVCATTDANGSYSLTGLAATGSGLLASTSGYVNGLWPFSPTGNMTGISIYLRSTTRVGTLVSQAGATWDGTTGAIHFLTRDGSGNLLAGVTIAVDAGGKAAYFNNGTLDATLTATTALGEGYVFGLGAATVNVTFTSPNRVCAHSGVDGWTPTASGATAGVPIVNGDITFAGAVCQ
jgi:hypothetical protein